MNRLILVLSVCTLTVLVLITPGRTPAAAQAVPPTPPPVESEEGTAETPAETEEVESTSPVTGTQLSLAGIYAGLRPAASSPGLYTTLILFRNEEAELTSNYLNDEPPIIERGEWAEVEGGRAQVTLTEKNGTPYSEPKQLTFELRDDLLVLVDYDKSVYGEEGMELRRQSVVRNEEGEPRAFLTLDLEAGFALDPFFVSANAGGGIDVSSIISDCPGFVNGEPVVSVDWNGEAEMLKAFFYSEHDPMLLVRTPSGDLLCNDDAHANLLDPVIEIPTPERGRYTLWLGSFAPDQLIPGVLVLTARPDVDLGTFSLGGLIDRGPIHEELPAPPVPVAAGAVAEAEANYQGEIATLGPESGAATISISAAGELSAFDVTAGSPPCAGFIGAAPDSVVEWSGESEHLNVFFEGDADSALLVVTPDGTILCSDDAASGNRNPHVVVAEPAAGRYLVFVGRLGLDEPVAGTLTVSGEADAAPQTLAPEAP